MSAPTPIPADVRLSRGSVGSTVNDGGKDYFYRLEPGGDDFRATAHPNKYCDGPLMRRGKTWEEATWNAHLAFIASEMVQA